MPSDKKLSQLGIHAEAALRDDDRISLFCPAEAAPADQNQTSEIGEMRKKLGIPFNNLTAVVAPTASDDSGSNYAANSHWVDTVTEKIYVCISAAPGAAVWKDLTDRGALVEPAKINATASAVPAIDDDSAGGYSVGSHWIWPAQKRIWVCVNASANAAVWEEVSDTTTDGPLNNWSAVAIPSTGDDADDGYSVGSQWLWPAEGRQWVCKVSTVGAAQWEELTALITLVQNNFAATAAPDANDDSGDGYAQSSVWRWKQRIWICADATLTAAVWVEQNLTVLNYVPYTIDSTFSAGDVNLGRVPFNATIVDVRISVFGEVAPFNPDWDVDFKINGSNRILNITSTAETALAVEDLSKTISNKNVSGGDIVSIYVTEAGVKLGLEVILILANPVV